VFSSFVCFTHSWDKLGLVVSCMNHLVRNGRKNVLQTRMHSPFNGKLQMIEFDLLEMPFVFSSPEHFVLRVSYCDRPLSVVRRRPSCVVRRA